jgi:hypothetical protein
MEVNYEKRKSLKEKVILTGIGLAGLIGLSSFVQAATLFRSDGDTYSATNISKGTLGVTVDGGGDVPSTGSKGFVRVPYKCTITEATMLADVSGSAVMDVKKSTYGDFPTTSSIMGASKPTLSSEQKSTDTTLTGVSANLDEGDVLEFNLDSATTITRLTLFLKVKKA